MDKVAFFGIFNIENTGDSLKVFKDDLEKRGITTLVRYEK